MKDSSIISTLPFRANINSMIHSISRVSVVTILFIILLFAGGCKEWLELDPSGDIVQDDYWLTGEQAVAVVSGCYKSMTETDFMDRVILWGEGRSDNVVVYMTNSLDYLRMVNVDLSPTNSLCTWSPFYRVINRCNTFLEKAPAVMKNDPTFSPQTFQSLKAEVITIRALCYFYLVRAYRNVPWVDKAATSPDQDFNIKQSPDSVIIARIIADLDSVYPNAPEKYLDPVNNNNSDQATYSYNKGRITKAAINALLADIYLWNNQYEMCVKMCDRIILSKKFSLDDYQHYFQNLFKKGNASESIFELQFGDGSTQQTNYSVAFNYYRPGFSSGSRLEFSPFLTPGHESSPFIKNLGGVPESEKDIRYYDFVDNASTPGFYRIFKYTGSEHSTDASGKGVNYLYKLSTSNWIVYRLADILLMKAEALVQLNRTPEDLKEALRLVNTTYLRANPLLLGDSLKIENYSDQLQMSDLILRERQRELLFEGKRYYDLMRVAIRQNSPATIATYNSDKLKGNTTQIGPNSLIDAIYLPVNSEVLKRNSNLKQNPYYVIGEDNVEVNN